ncbi:MAG TPA: tetratricopeptide repeat protein [Casimicrobiaceae bacterium]|nr:tetratricopeptide repeat protein [Casimicrobiaceae bacterium]
MILRILATFAVLYSGILLAQAPPPPPAAGAAAQPAIPGLPGELATANKLIHDGQYDEALEKVDAVLEKDARNPQARFLKGVIQTDQGETDEATATFQALIEEFPELPEPHNNMAVIWAQKGRYDLAKAELETALASHPDYAIAHENLGDIYTRLAGAEYDRALSLDKTNKSAQAKLALVRQMFDVPPSTSAPKPPVPKAAKAPKAPSPSQMK